MLNNRSAVRLLTLAPIVVPFAVVFLGGIALSVAQSFGAFSPVDSAVSGIAAYRRLLTDPWFLSNARFSASVAFRSAAISILGGMILAAMIRQLPRGYTGPAMLYQIPLILPHLTVALITILLFGNSGFLARIAAAGESLGMPLPWSSPLYDSRGHGLVIAYVFKGLPFATVLILPVLRRMDPRLIETAGMLGAGRTATFLKVIVPEIVPVSASAFIILFLYAFGAYDIPFVLGSARPQMLSIAAYNLYFERQLAMRPIAFAMLSLMAAASFLLLYVYGLAIRRLETPRTL